jgi:polysaccharide export outer membrane protein
MAKTKRLIGITATMAIAAMLMSAAASAQSTQRQGATQGSKPSAAQNSKTPTPPPALPPNYVIGVNDVLTIQVWRETDVSGDVVVRPDGKITLHVGNDIVAAGLTTDELKVKVTEEMKRFYEDPAVTIQVKEIHSRNVFITGAVQKPGPYMLSGPLTVAQLIAIAGGLQEFADKKHVMLVSGSLKDKKGEPLTYVINYDELSRGKNVAKYNFELRPGDTVIVR